MKKLIILLILIIIPLNVYADEVDYDITNYYIDADILENGNMNVKELIVMDGKFNGYEREIAFKNSKLVYNSEIDFEHDAIYNATDITNYKTYAKHVSDVSFDTFNEKFTPLKEVSDVYNASNGDVVITNFDSRKKFRMYYKTHNEKTAFLITYTLENVVVLHDDIAELYWQFIGDEYEDEIYDLQIRVNLPGIDESSRFRVWSHIDTSKKYSLKALTGEIHKYDDKYALATLDKLPTRTPVDIRMTFEKGLITDTSFVKKSNTNATNGILKVEKKRANEANELRKKYKKIYKAAVIFASVGIVYQLLSIFYIYRKYDKEYESDFKNDYNREFNDDYSVEVVDYIMNKKITPNAMSASIMNLIYKKNIKAEKITNEKKDEYKFTFLNYDNTTNEEKELIDFLFNRVGNQGVVKKKTISESGIEINEANMTEKQTTFTTIQLKQYAKSTKTYDKFISNYTKWKNNVISKGKSLKIFESHGGVIAYSAIVSCIFMFLFFASSGIGVLNIPLVIDLILSIGIFIYTLTFNKRTKYGNDQYVRWKAFKKFLLDFGSFDIKELPEIALWERYMVYATVLGVAKKVSKDMNVKIKEMNLDESSFTFTDYYFYSTLSYNLNSSVSSAISMANATQAAQVSSSSWSSGSGGGGGFSSGGGFGGGGGGGHGF